MNESPHHGFYVTLTKKVIIMENKKTKTQVVEVYNTELIYVSCVFLV